MINQELIEETFSIINEDDSFKESKKFHLRNWCNAFSVWFSNNGAERLPFFLEVLSDDQCWERTDSMHPIKLNRRKASRKMVQLQNWKGRNNPLDNYDRYRLACCCCLEEDIAILFENLRQERRANTTESLKMLAVDLSRDQLSEPLTIYWSHIMGQCASDLQLGGKNIYEYGFDLLFRSNVAYVEAVEYFWNKIKTLPEYVLKSQRKYQIIMTLAMCIAGCRVSTSSEILEFCFSQITPDLYQELLNMDIAKIGGYCILAELPNNLSFDAFQKLFNCLKPDNINPVMYYNVLKFTGIEDYPGYSTREAMALFMHVLRRDDFDKHHAYLIDSEMNDRGNLLVSLTEKNFMEALWAVLDKVKPDQMEVFMKSDKASCIISILHERGDTNSLKKFFSYHGEIKSFENPGTSIRDINLSTDKKICLDRVWAELDKANATELEAFVTSETFFNVYCEIRKQKDLHLLRKFFSYDCIIKGIDIQGIHMNLDAGPESKRRRTE